MWKHRHNDGHLRCLLELDRDHLYDRVRGLREYSRLWGISYRQARRLVTEYEAARRTWIRKVPDSADRKRINETPELLRKVAVGGPPADHNLIDIESPKEAGPVGVAPGPPKGPERSVDTARAGVSTTELALRAAHRDRSRRGWKPSESEIKRWEGGF